MLGIEHSLCISKCNTGDFFLPLLSRECAGAPGGKTHESARSPARQGPQEFLSLMLVQAPSPAISQFTFNCSYQPLATSVTFLLLGGCGSLYSTVSSFYDGSWLCDLYSLTCLRTVVNSQFVQPFSSCENRTGITTTKLFTCWNRKQKFSMKLFS